MKKYNVTATNIFNGQQVRYNNVNIFKAVRIRKHYNKQFIKSKYCIITEIEEA